MKARVYVSMKPTVLDPQGQTICAALNGLGYAAISSVRQGKYFEIGLPEDTPHAAALDTLDTIARDVLSNPVIEDYRVEIITAPKSGSDPDFPRSKTPTDAVD